MPDQIQAHYSGASDLSETIEKKLLSAGKKLEHLKTSDLSAIDEFHSRGRKATLELGSKMNLDSNANVLDIGSGLGGPARTLAEEYGCHVTGVDLTQAFCDTAQIMSHWVNLDEFVSFQQGNATELPFDDHQFDAAMTIHVAMNISAKNKMYEEAHRVIKTGGIFAVYDVLKGEGGEVLYPVHWANESSMSFLATQKEMETLLTEAGFEILGITDTTEESMAHKQKSRDRMKDTPPPPVTSQVFLGNDFSKMDQNWDRNLLERRTRTVSLICKA